ncbi:hypothetical protein BAZSYMA_ACONTIG00454_3 [Bathymodiolus azoricus thioautotrophic gill symbiont]|uniref:Uncharacterized protein n=1 Tax=Bathymodiolus azoricus thioautotrophic gill symbiont TaxID=235205 RepID=A0A1H6JS67_9GAMM|nr:hypothetical protein BAZSYMA_ACONTIG00454_3 [Bathymodiolus azoricus thioautotrophic gill symbiont]
MLFSRPPVVETCLIDLALTESGNLLLSICMSDNLAPISCKELSKNNLVSVLKILLGVL